LAFEKAATSGTFSLVYGATEPTKTTSLAFDAKPEDVVVALEALGDIEPGEVKASAIPTGGWALTFAKEKQNLAVVGVADDTTDTKLAQRYNTWDIHPVWLVASFTFVTGLMGVFLAIPMKRQMINHEQLPFPSGIAAAETLRSLYSASKEATRKAYVLVIGLGIGAVIAILRTGSGILQKIDTLWLQLGNVLPYMVGPKDAADPSKGLEVKSGPIPEHLPHDGFSTLHGKIMNGFSIDTGGLLVAAGMIVGIRVSLSMLIGSCILYFWLGPMLAEADHAAALASTPNYIKNIDVTGDGKQYLFMRWGLWGGTALMVMASLTALAFQWKTIVRAFSARKGGGDESAASLAAMDQIEVPFVWMVIGMIPITIAMVIIQYVAFNISWWAGLIAVAMSFVLSLVASRATGETDTTPIGAMGKVMQLLFAFLKPGQIGPNLASAGIAANSASSCADLLTDLKIGYLLGANPRRQFLAQFWGVFFGTVAIVPIWFLMVPTKAKLESLPAPATRTWEKVAKVLTEGIDSLPQSAQVAILVGAAIGVLLPLIEKFVIPAKYRKYMISATGLGLAFMLPFYNSLAFTIGAVIALLWAKWNKRTADLYTVPLASGLVAGESLIAAFIAMLATASGLMGWNL
jgi:OPT family oligopeptide transporter